MNEQLKYPELSEDIITAYFIDASGNVDEDMVDWYEQHKDEFDAVADIFTYLENGVALEDIPEQYAIDKIQQRLLEPLTDEEIRTYFLTNTFKDNGAIDDYEHFTRHNHHDAFMAGLELGIEPENIEDAYQGYCDDDVDFAQQLAESIGAINEVVMWPYTCIDWEYAAKELMYDYSTLNGYYFRDL